MADAPAQEEIGLQELERNRLGTQETSLGEIVKEQIGSRRERAQVADIISITVIRAFFTLVLLALFGWLNYQVMSLVRDIFEKTGTLDKEVVMTLIAGTVTEVAAVMYIMAQFLFPKSRE